MLRLFPLRRHLQAARLRLLQLAGLGGERDLAVALLALAGEETLDVRALAFRLLADEGDLALALLHLDRESFLHPRGLKRFVPGDEGQLPGSFLFFDCEPALHLGPFELDPLRHQRDVAVVLLALAGERALDVGRLAPAVLLDDRDILADLRRFHRFRLGDLLLLHLPALLEDETLLLAQHPGPFVCDLLLLTGFGECLVLVQVEHFEAGLQAPLPHRRGQSPPTPCAARPGPSPRWP